MAKYGLSYNFARRIAIVPMEGPTDLSGFTRTFLAALGLLAFCLANTPAIYAQGIFCKLAISTPPPSYSVTSVKEDARGDINKPIHSEETPDGLYIRNQTLELMIRVAYGVRSYQIVGAPGWVNEREWEVGAKADDAETQKLKTMDKAAARSERCLLLQSLLAERFKLVVHQETRSEPALALVVAKGGPKFKEVSPTPPGQTPKPPMVMENGILTFNGYPITGLAAVLSQVMGQTVVDKTGLTGRYEFTIPWTKSEVEVTTSTPTGDAVNADSGPSIVTVLREKLGLRLESEKVPTDVIVIDHVEQPSPN
jgi:uncharacterized protein (TIGR03435 family)